MQDDGLSWSAMDSGTKTALIGLTGTALGYSLNFVSTFVTNRSAAKRADIERIRFDRWKIEDIRRERLEELYGLVDSFLKSMGGTFMLSLIYMNGKFSADQYNQSSRENMDKYPIRLDRIEMLIAMYFGRLQADWRQVMSVRDKANELRPLAGSSLTAEHRTKSRLIQFGIEIEIFNNLAEAFKVKLTDLSKDMLINL